jgi:crotonobetainyl-CoA:carnitine CoA-transferase CaiB-like acyl-CoA transferase
VVLDASRYVLSGVRVLELDRFVAAASAAKLFAELGADVVAIEPREGHALRRRRIVRQVQSDSLFRYLSTNKTLVTLNLALPADVGHLVALASEADVVITDLPRAELSALFAAIGGLEGLYRNRIVVRVKAYAGKGPRGSLPSSYLTAAHSSGEPYLVPGGQGGASNPPTKVGQYASEYDAGLQAVISALAALYARRRGVIEGENVEVSIQGSTANMARASLGAFTAEGRIESRASRGRRVGSTIPCADGHVELVPNTNEEVWARLVDVMGNPEWCAAPDLATATGRTAHVGLVNDRLAAWAAHRTRQEIVDACQTHHVPAGGVCSVAEVLQSPQLRHRGFFQVSEDGAVYPRLPFTLLRGGLPPVRECSSSSRARFAARPKPDARAGQAAAQNGLRPATPGRPLAGIRVVEFSWFWAVPHACQLLAALGAEVIKVESHRRPDPTRLLTTRSTEDSTAEQEMSTSYHDVNLGKRSVSLDLSTDFGRAEALRLIESADLVISNFSVGVMERLGLGYDVVHRINPGAIVISESAYGEDGPQSHYVGFAVVFGALSGLQDCSGYPDAPPADIRDGADLRVAASCALVAMALLSARQAGNCSGEFASVSAVECCVRFIGEAVVEAGRGGPVYSRNGNHDPHYCPNNAYPCAGVDQWVSLTIKDDDDWRTLLQVTGLPELAQCKYASVESRMANEAELDAVLGAWTRQFEPDDLTRQLVRHGIAASPTFTSKMLFEDPELVSAGFTPTVHHRYLGERAVIGMPWEFATLDGSVVGPAPLLGEANSEFLSHLR